MGFDLALFNKVSSADIGSKAASQSRREKKENAWAQIETRAAEIKEKFEQEAAQAADFKQWCDKEIAEFIARKKSLMLV